MPRRFDKRGWNRQFKWQPVRSDRWDPFPKDHLPFVDDYSALNTMNKAEVEINSNGKRPLPGDDSARKKPRTRSEVEAEHAARRAYRRALQREADAFGSPPRRKMTHHEKVTNRLFYAGLGLATLGATAVAGSVAEADALFYRRNGITFSRLLYNSARSAWRNARREVSGFHLH